MGTGQVQWETRGDGSGRMGDMQGRKDSRGSGDQRGQVEWETCRIAQRSARRNTRSDGYPAVDQFRQNACKVTGIRSNGHPVKLKSDQPEA